MRIGPLLAWILPIWRGELGVARSTILLSGVGATLLGSLADAGMEAGLLGGTPGLILFVLSAAMMSGFALLTVVAVWRAARRHPGVGAGFAVAFAIFQAVLMFGDIGYCSLAALGTVPSPAHVLTMMTQRAIP